MTGTDLLAIALAGVITYAIRASFLTVAERMTAPPERVRTVLRMIPAAALAAITMPTLLRPDAASWDPVNAIAIGGLAAVFASIWKRNIGLSLLVGLGVVVLVRPWVG